MADDRLDQKLIVKAGEQGYTVIQLPHPIGARRWRLEDRRTGTKSNEAGMDADQLQKVIEGDGEERRLQGLPPRSPE